MGTRATRIVFGSLVLATCVALLAAPWASGMNNANQNVTISIPSETHLDLSSCPNASAATSFNSLARGSSATTGIDCAITFGSANDSAALRVAQQDESGTAMQSGAAAFPDYLAGTSSWFQGAGSFGACLRSVTGLGTADWTIDVSCPAVDGSFWNAIPTSTSVASAKIAHTTLAGISLTVALRFGARVPASQPTGVYTAALLFEVLAPNV